MTYSLNGNGCHEEIGERIRSTIYNLSILPRSLAASAVLNIPFEISGHRKTKVGGSGCVADQERAHRPGDDIKIDASFAMGKARNVSATRGSSPDIAMFEGGFARPSVARVAPPVITYRITIP